ncbi:MAG: response regulator transcription factor [Flavobacteriales bacterium]|nr:response regulator transcription factor [Flavobacteriales bacterium]
MNGKEVLIIEDEGPLVELLQLHLQDLGFNVTSFENGKMGLAWARNHPFDLLILDINLPGIDGLEICRQLRDTGIRSPILMLTARTDERDKIVGLETGADDYVTKPFSIKEFLARVKAIFRRAEMDKEAQRNNVPTIRYKQLEIDRAKRKVCLDGNRVELTPKEFDLLVLLASNPGVTYNRRELLERAWGYDFEGYEHTVNSHINRLRSKVEKDPDHPEYVLTTWGVGYRFNDQP